MARPTHAGPVWRPVPLLGCLCSCQGAGVPTGCRARRSRLGRSRTLGHRVWKPWHHRGSSPSGERAHDVVRVVWREALRWGARRGVLRRLPAHDGPAGIGRAPSSRLDLMIEIRAGQARERAEARQGLTLERWFGGEGACHRKADGAPDRRMCQRVIAVGVARVRSENINTRRPRAPEGRGPSAVRNVPRGCWRARKTGSKASGARTDGVGRARTTRST